MSEPLFHPAPIFACGLCGPIRNTIAVVVSDVECATLVGKRPSSLSALAAPLPSELLLHPVGSFVAVRKIAVPPNLLPEHHQEQNTDESRVLAKPWPPGLHP